MAMIREGAAPAPAGDDTAGAPRWGNLALGGDGDGAGDQAIGGYSVRSQANGSAAGENSASSGLLAGMPGREAVAGVAGVKYSNADPGADNQTAPDTSAGSSEEGTSPDEAVAEDDADLDVLLGKEFCNEFSGLGKPKHVDEGVAEDSSGETAGFVEPTLKEAHTTSKSGSDYGVDLKKFDLHTKVHIRPSGSGDWESMMDFAEFYGGQPSVGSPFGTYEGTMLHEQTHVKEAVGAYDQVARNLPTPVGCPLSPAAQQTGLH